MTSTSSDALIAIFVMFGVGAFIAAAMLFLSSFLGPSKYRREKSMVYECGVDPVGSAHDRISVKYYLVSILFLLFDLEAAFLLPMALSWRSMSALGVLALACLGFFLFFFILGIWYDFKSKALEWER